MRAIARSSSGIAHPLSRFHHPHDDDGERALSIPSSSRRRPSDTDGERESASHPPSHHRSSNDGVGALLPCSPHHPDDDVERAPPRSYHHPIDDGERARVCLTGNAHPPPSTYRHHPTNDDDGDGNCARLSSSASPPPSRHCSSNNGVGAPPRSHHHSSNDGMGALLPRSASPAASFGSPSSGEYFRQSAASSAASSFSSSSSGEFIQQSTLFEVPAVPEGSVSESVVAFLPTPSFLNLTQQPVSSVVSAFLGFPVPGHTPLESSSFRAVSFAGMGGVGLSSVLPTSSLLLPAR